MYIRYLPRQTLAFFGYFALSTHSPAHLTVLHWIKNGYCRPQSSTHGEVILWYNVLVEH